MSYHNHLYDHTNWTDKLRKHTHQCQQWRSHLWVDTAQQLTTSQLRVCFLPDRPSPVCAETPLSVVFLVGTSTAPAEEVQGSEGSCTPPALTKATGDGLPFQAVVTGAEYVCGCVSGSRHSWMPEPELGRQQGRALLDHQGCWGSCYCCRYCLIPSWQTVHEGGLLPEKVRKDLEIASLMLRWTKCISRVSFRVESSAVWGLSGQIFKVCRGNVCLENFIPEISSNGSSSSVL